MKYKKVVSFILLLTILSSLIFFDFDIDYVNAGQPYTILAGNNKDSYDNLMDIYIANAKNGWTDSNLKQQYDALYEKIKYELPLDTPKTISNTYNFQGEQILNIELWLDRHIVVYGDYKFLNPRTIDFKDYTMSESGIGYYTKDGVKGEYRYQGYDRSGNRYGNFVFPPDTPVGTASKKKWIYEFWNAPYIPDKISVYNNRAIAGNKTIEQWINGFKDFEIKYGINPDGTSNSSTDLVRYMNVSSAPSLEFPGVGKMWHKSRYDGKIYYETFTLPPIGFKTPTDITSTTNVLENNLILKSNMSSITFPVKINTKILDEFCFDGIDDVIDDVTYYHRYDISTWEWDLVANTLIEKKQRFNEFGIDGGDIYNPKPPNERFMQIFDVTISRNQLESIAVDGKATIKFDSSAIAKYKNQYPENGDKTSNIARSSDTVTILIEDGGFDSNFEVSNQVSFSEQKALNKEHIMYSDTSTGDRTRYEYVITHNDTGESDFYSYNGSYVDNNSVDEFIYNFLLRYTSNMEIGDFYTFKLEQKIINTYGQEDTHIENITLNKKIDEVKIVEIDVSLPRKAFDVINYKPYDNTDLTECKDKWVLVDGQYVDYDYFFSGNYKFGKITSNNNTELSLVEIHYISTDDIPSFTKQWVTVYNTTPKVQLKLSGTTRENRKITITNTSEQANDPYLLQYYPITYTWNYIALDGTDSNRRMKDFGDSYKELLYKKEGMYRVRITGRNSLGYSDTYDLDFIITKDLEPAVELHIWNSTLTRGETFTIHHSVSSTEGDVITENILEIWHDSNNDGDYDTLLDTMNAVDFTDYTPSKLGKYKLVNKVKEGFGQETISEFITEDDKIYKTVEREFVVQNLRPMTQLEVGQALDFPMLDVFIMLDKELERDAVNYILDNKIEYINFLRGNNILPQVETWDMHTYTYTQPAYATKNTGSSYPPSTMSYSSGGYTGTLTRYKVVNNSYWHDFGYWSTRQECSTVPVYETVSVCDAGYTDLDCIFTVTIQTGTTTVCNDVSYWVSDMRLVNNYTGYYSGDIYKNVRQEYVNPFRNLSDKYVIYIADTNISELSDLEMVLSKADVKLILVGDETIKSQIAYNKFYSNNKSIELIMTDILNDIVAENPYDLEYKLLLGETFNYTFTDIDEENDPIVERKYQYVQDFNYFDNSLGKEDYTSTNYSDYYWIDTKYNVFNTVGKYELYRRIKDAPIGYESMGMYSNEPKINFIVHRKPIAKAELDWVYNPATSLYETTWVDLSYDLDHQYSREDKGIIERTIKYRKNGGEWYYKIPDNLSYGNYELEYYVKDLEGTWSEAYTLYFTLNPAPPVQIDAKAYSSVPASEDLLIYDIWSRYPYEEKLNFSIYQGSTRKTSIEEVILTASTGIENGQDINWFDVSYNIPSTLPDGDYTLKVSGIDRLNSSIRTDKDIPIKVNTPINIVSEIPNKITANRPIQIGAETTKYVNTCQVVLFKGTGYQRTINLTSTQIGDIKNWTNTFTGSYSILEGIYNAEIQATTYNGKIETKVVTFEYIRNSAPSVNIIEVLPGYIYEGDNVISRIQVNDADKEQLILDLELFKDSSLIWNNARTININASGNYDELNENIINNIEPGNYTLKATVKDGYNETGTSEINFTVNTLSIIGKVEHTIDWDNNRKNFNISKTGTEDSPRTYNVFWSGEKFILSAETTIIDPSSSVVANTVNVSILSTPYSVNLSTTDGVNWNGSLWHEDMIRWDSRNIIVRFIVNYSNGTQKVDDINIIIDNDEEYWRLHKIF